MGIIHSIQFKIKQKLERHEQGLHVVLIFPIAFACLLTFAGARIVSTYWPFYYVEWAPGLHVHHFAYGFFILAASGYLSLIFSGPRAKFLISLLYGCGLGMAFDEFAMWVHLREDDVARWQYDGLVIVLSAFFILLTLQPGLKFLFAHWPFTKRKLLSEQLERQPYNWDAQDKSS